MYVCMYVCMYVYVCMYTCMYACMYMYACMHVCILCMLPMYTLYVLGVKKLSNNNISHSQSKFKVIYPRESESLDTWLVPVPGISFLRSPVHRT